MSRGSTTMATTPSTSHHKTFMGVEFANPLSIPLERRLQTLTVILYFFLFLVAPVLCVITPILLIRYSSYWWLSLLYFAWYYFDLETPARGSRYSPLIRRLPLWNWFRDYFPIRLVKTAELDPSRNYIIGYHPHGIMSMGCFTNFTTEATNFSKIYPGIKARCVTLVGQFWFPFRREYIMLLGAIEASKSSIKHCLTREGKGNALVIVIGGASEALDAHPGNFDLLINRRRGFVRLALKYGADLVPVYSFGENDLYIQIENPEGSMLRTIQVWLKQQLGFSPPLFHGRGIFNYTFGLLPYRRPVTTVVGAPIRVERVEHPTEDQINDLHQKYKDALYAHFETHKKNYGIADDVHLRFH